ncbi:MAG: aconitate hydratase AcnA [Alphaproteobacteria bacterium]
MPANGTARDASARTLDVRRSLTAGGIDYDYFSLPAAAESLGDLSRLPMCMKVLLENLLRHEDGVTVTATDIAAVAGWADTAKGGTEIAFRPARVLMQDFTGVPAVVDLAAMREAMSALGGDPRRINPLVPVDLVIDHSVIVDQYGNPKAFAANVAREYERNAERYAFLRWGQMAFDDLRVVPPGTGICHQVNLEYLARTVWSRDDGGRRLAYPDSLVGTDSHTTMINGLSVLGWGVGGIEAEAAMLGQPVSMLVPEVIGFRLSGKLKEGATATDLVLTVTQMLRKRGVVGKFVEFFGPGLAGLALADRATIANMAPEYGATCGFFPTDDETLAYLRFSGRDDATVALVEAYARAQGLWREDAVEAVFTDVLDLDLASVEPSLAGPKRPQDRVALSNAAAEYRAVEAQLRGAAAGRNPTEGQAADMMEEGGGSVPVMDRSVAVEGSDYRLDDGAVVVAAITSCTNTSNPAVMLAAGLVARKAREHGLSVKPWVKTSLAPGSQVVTDYLDKAGLSDDLNALGFDLVGYGCTTCIGNSGPLAEPIHDAVVKGNLIVTSVLSGNRNFEGRVHPLTQANYLASPPLVVAYALAGTMRHDLTREPLGEGSDGKPVMLADIWPSQAEVQEAMARSVTPEMFRRRYGDVFKGDAQWQAVPAEGGMTYAWQAGSTYVQNPVFFDGIAPVPEALDDIRKARPLALLGDSVTTDHISPAGSIPADSPAGAYLLEHQVRRGDFNSYGSRRGNHEVMVRGTLANIRLRNTMAGGREGGWTRHMPSGEVMTIYDAAMRYREEGVPLIIFAGKEYGTGSSRDWAAKGTRLLGVKAVVAESFERIHRSNLIGMGVLPIQLPDGETLEGLKLDGGEVIDVSGITEAELRPGSKVALRILRANGYHVHVNCLCRIDTPTELEYFRHGGILPYVLRGLAGLRDDAVAE